MFPLSLSGNGDRNIPLSSFRWSELQWYSSLFVLNRLLKCLVIKLREEGSVQSPKTFVGPCNYLETSSFVPPVLVDPILKVVGSPYPRILLLIQLNIFLCYT